MVNRQRPTNIVLAVIIALMLVWFIAHLAAITR